ncbi:MAG: glycosyltransferase family 9 protein [Rhizobiales bacterium]|nr:glycosyltransferase family 9 protein [Hyphomicrobiales bacterium]
MKILFITSTRLGDAVLSTGLLAGLMERYPDARFTIACGPVVVPIFEHAPRVDKIIPMRKEKRAGHWRKLLRETIFTRWDLVVDLRGSATAWVLWTKKRHILRANHTDHRVLHNASVAGFEPARAPCVWPGEASRKDATALIPDGRQVLAIGPSAAWPSKMWPLERFVELVTRLTARGGPMEDAYVLISAGPNEREQCAPLLAAIPKDRQIIMIDKSGPESGELSLVAAAFERVRLYVGNDSGLMHLAAAAGAPTLGLFGPTSDKLYDPWGEKCVSVRGRSQEDIVAETGTGYFVANGMQDLTVDKVYEEACKLLTRT